MCALSPGIASILMSGTDLPIGGQVVEGIPIYVHDIGAITLMGITHLDLVVAGLIPVLPLLDLNRGLLVLGLCLAVGLDFSRSLEPFHFLLLDLRFAARNRAPV